MIHVSTLQRSWQCVLGRSFIELVLFAQAAPSSYQDQVFGSLHHATLGLFFTNIQRLRDDFRFCLEK